jgi:type I restriction enzyme, S subunit
MVSAMAAVKPSDTDSHGFQMTEIGMIPNDWQTRQIKEVCKLINGRGFKPHEWRASGLPIIRIQNLNGSDEFNYFDGSYAKKLEVENGQLLFAWSGSRGTSFGPHIWHGSKGLLNYHTWKISIDSSRIDDGFLYYALKGLTKFIEDQAHGASALVHVQKWQMEGFQIALPVKSAEQQEIAEALSDADALIESLAQLLAKKREIKQGAMQELLTGKRRLVGFEGEWRNRSLGDLATMKSGEGITSARIDNSSAYPCYGGNGLRGYTSDYNHDGRYALIGRVGALCGNINLADGRFFASEHAIVVYPRPDVSTDWLAYILQYANLNRLSEASAQPVLTVSKLNKLEFPVPIDKLEQDAIAEFMADLDDNITELETQYQKACQIKNGMMQELLTGRIRLV